jgi:hypothetical protein
MEVSEAKRLRMLEDENRMPKKPLAEPLRSEMLSLICVACWR